MAMTYGSEFRMYLYFDPHWRYDIVYWDLSVLRVINRLQFRGIGKTWLKE